MPLYEYRCVSCGRKFEALQKFSDDPLTVDPECGGTAERLISSSSFHFKGTGWYVTDYAKNNGAPTPDGKPETKPEKSGTAEKSATSASSESKPTESKPAETKPAATTEATKDK